MYIVDTEYEKAKMEKEQQQQEEQESTDKLLSFINDGEQEAYEDDSGDSDFYVKVTVDVDPTANYLLSTPKNDNVSKNQSGLKKDFLLDPDTS